MVYLFTDRRAPRCAALLACLALGACGGGGGGGGSITGGGPGGGAVTQVTVSGKVTFERVPNDPVSSGLDYAAAFESPVRGAVVEAVDAVSAAVLASTDSDVQGDYSLRVPASTRMFVRVRARMLRTGAPGWDFQVVDNTSGKAGYVLDGADFDSGTQDLNRDLFAPSGWDGAAYTGARSAAPFAILDAVYDAASTVLDVAPDTSFPLLQLNWSPDNVPACCDEEAGQISTTFYRSGEIFVLGAANNDTDEYDRHVLSHEWGHYFEDSFSRADSVGGDHTTADRLDARVAFSEGWGYAFAGIVADDPVTRDSFGSQQASGFAIDVERNANRNRGWYSEGSLQSLLYDFYDADNEGLDSVTLGFAPVYDIMVGAQRDTDLLTTVFSFVPALKAANPASAAGIDALVAEQNMVAVGMNELATGETNDANSADALPVYVALDIGATVNVCSNDDFGTFNKLTNRRFVVFEVTTNGAYDITAAGPFNSDPDLKLYDVGFLLIAQSEEPGFERVTEASGSLPTLGPGRYVLEVYEFSNTTDAPRGRTCFDVRVDPA